MMSMMTEAVMSSLSAEQIALWLRKHPHFFDDHPALLTHLLGVLD